MAAMKQVYRYHPVCAMPSEGLHFASELVYILIDCERARVKAGALAYISQSSMTREFQLFCIPIPGKIQPDIIQFIIPLADTIRKIAPSLFYAAHLPESTLQSIPRPGT